MSFIFGGDTNITAAQAQRQRELANMFVQQMANERVARNAPEGIVSLANSLASMIAGNRATRSEQKLQGEASKQFSDLLANLDSPSMSPTGTGRATGQRSLSFSDAGQSPSKQAFINELMPFAQEASKRTGIDPRIIIAQSAQETGWGKHAPANNFFGIKSHGKPGGQELATNEVVNGNTQRIRDSFRQYENLGDSVSGYADFMLENPRYTPMREAQGLDAQLEALGTSGYATDPNYAQSVGAIARGIDLPQSSMSTFEPQAAPRETGPSYNRIRQFGTLLANPYLGAGEKAVVQSMMDAEVRKLSADPLDNEMKRLQMDNLRSQMDARNTPKPIAIEREYQLAQQGGYDGSFADYIQYRKGKGIEIGPDGTVRIGGGVKKATEGQSRANIYATRMEASNRILDDLEGEGTELSSLLASGLPIAGNYLLDEDYRKYSQAQRDFINAALRQESGAVISEAEFVNARQQYFPQPGDGPETIAQKRQNRIIAMEAIRDASGPFNQGNTSQQKRLRFNPETGRLE